MEKTFFLLKILGVKFFYFLHNCFIKFLSSDFQLKYYSTEFSTNFNIYVSKIKHKKNVYKLTKTCVKLFTN